MTIKDDAFYPISDVLKFVTWNSRKLQRYAKNKNIRKIDNRYLFTGADIKRILQKIEKDATKTRQRRVKASNIKTLNAIDDAMAQGYNIPANIVDLINEIDNNTYVEEILNAVNNDIHLEQFSDDEYLKFRDRLIEANILEKRIADYKEEIKRMEDYIEDYRQTIQYLRTSLNKRGDEMQKLLDSLGTSLTSTTERNYIEAKEKNII